MKLNRYIHSIVLGACLAVFLYGIEPPGEPKQSSGPSEFVCGTSRANEKESVANYYEFLARMKNFTALQSNDFAFDDVWVMEDDGSLFGGGIHPFDLDGQTIHFIPTITGFTISTIPFNYDTNLGTNLNLSNDGFSLVNLGFTFTYFNVGYTEVYIGANGVVSFGDHIHPLFVYLSRDFYNALPKIAAYFMDLNPTVAGGVFYKQEPGKATITWSGITENGQNNSNTFQLVMYNNGSFDITFNGIDATSQASGQPIYFGTHPGPSQNLEIIDFSEDLPYSSGIGAGVFETFTNLPTPWINPVAVAQKFYQTFPDSFDHLIMFTNFPHDVCGPGGSAFACARILSNSISGIGTLVGFDVSSWYGSEGRLQAYAEMNELDAWPDNPEQRFFGGDNFLTILAQEAGHRWGAFLRFQDSLGLISDLLLGRALVHWSYFVDSDHSSLEGGDWAHVSGDEYTSSTLTDFYFDLDEYIMGLRLPEEVTPISYISSPINNLLTSRSQPPPLPGATAFGTRVDVTIDQIIAANGPRLPAEPAAQKDFRMAFILLIQNGTTPSQSELDKIALFRRAWEDYFEISVDGRATLNTQLATSWPVASATGTIFNANTGSPLEDIRVESRERQFVQLVPSGGRYVFRYMQSDSMVGAENITILSRAFGFFRDSLVTSVSYGSHITQDFQMDSLSRGTLAGTVTDQNGTPVPNARVILHVYSEIIKDFDLETTTDTNGFYEFPDIFISYFTDVVYDRITIIPGIPFGIKVLESNFTVNAGQITTVDVQLEPADLLLVNDDPNSAYGEFFTEILDSLQVTFFDWKTLEHGSAIPVSSISLFNNPMIIWFTGDADTDVLSQIEQDSLANFLDNGGKLFLTGRNIAESLDAQGSPFLQNYLEVTYGGVLAGPPLIFPVASNPMSGGLAPFSAVQNSKDVIVPVAGGNTDSAFTYLTDGVAGVTIENIGSGSMTVFLGFGFEGVASNDSRIQVLHAILNWMNVVTAISTETAESLPRTFKLQQNYPNPFNPSTSIEFSLPRSCFVSLKVYNALGQEIASLLSEQLSAGNHKYEWNASGLASGLYFYRIDAGEYYSAVKKALLLK